MLKLFAVLKRGKVKEAFLLWQLPFLDPFCMRRFSLYILYYSSRTCSHWNSSQKCIWLCPRVKFLSLRLNRNSLFQSNFFFPIWKIPAGMNKSGNFLHSPHWQFFLNFIFKLDKIVVLSHTLVQIAKAHYLSNLRKKPSNFFYQEALGHEKSRSWELTFRSPNSPLEEYCLLSILVTGFTYHTRKIQTSYLPP